MCFAFDDMSLGSLGVGCYGLMLVGPLIHSFNLYFIVVVLRDSAGGSAYLQEETLRDLVLTSLSTLKDIIRRHLSAHQQEDSPELNPVLSL